MGLRFTELEPAARLDLETLLARLFAGPAAGTVALPAGPM
jgi:hypothetical protein